MSAGAAATITERFWLLSGDGPHEQILKLSEMQRDRSLTGRRARVRVFIRLMQTVQTDCSKF